MKVYKTLTIGEFHKNFCEDYLISAEYGKNKQLFAVLDGCSMGNESHFVATLTGKILKKVAQELFHTDTENPQNLEADLKEILKQIFENLKNFRNQLLLEKNDLLATLILLVLDTHSNHGELIAIGDGYVALDGNITEYDHNNIPDYLGYHLTEDFESWYQSQTQRISFTNFKDLSICTDGILTFNHFVEKKQHEFIDPIHYMLLDHEFAESKNMFVKKLMHLEKAYSLKHTDDLAIIRIINA